MLRSLSVCVACGVSVICMPLSMAADGPTDYPARPVRMVIAQTPGSSIDAMGRVLATKLSELLGEQFVVDNRTGAGGTIGAGIVAHAEPDGYTIFGVATASQVIGPHLYKSLVNYDPFRDFAPVSMFAVTQNILVVNPQTPFHTVKDLIGYAKSNPGKLNWANAGSGFQSHLAGVLFTHMANIQVLHVPYKGAGASLTSVVGGESSVSIVPAPSVVGHLNSGRLRALAMGGDKRSSLMPDMPTIIESGVPGYVSNGWGGIVAPVKTQPLIRDKLYQAVVKAMRDPTTNAAMIKLGAEPMASTSAEFAAVIKRDWKSFGDAIRVSGIKPN
jgi:tripartite-type tricarboxylate transporter receptor subunit TctC